MSALTRVEVGLIVDDTAAVIALNSWAEPILATRVQWRADAGRRGVVVCVTAFAETHRSWYDPRFFVAEGLNSEPPPPWVPGAPDWFWAAVKEMVR